MRATIRVVGDKALARKLSTLSDRVAGQALERALVAGGLPILNLVKEHCPWITGNLRRSYHIGGHVGESGGLERTTGTDIGGNVASRTHAEIAIGTNVEYAPPVEYGSGNRPAKPHLRRGFDEGIDDAKQEVVEALRDLLRNA